MEVIANSSAVFEWHSLAPFYPRFNALFPAVQNPYIKYINSLTNLTACSWKNEITFANIMCSACAQYIADNPNQFPHLRAIIISGHDICYEKKLVIPSGLGRLPALTMLGLEYGKSCEINEPLANIQEIHFNELSYDLAKQVESKLYDNWVSKWFPNCQATIWH